MTFNMFIGQIIARIELCVKEIITIYATFYATVSAKYINTYIDSTRHFVNIYATNISTTGV